MSQTIALALAAFAARSAASAMLSPMLQISCPQSQQGVTPAEGDEGFGNNGGGGRLQSNVYMLAAVAGVGDGTRLTRNRRATLTHNIYHE